MSSKTPVFINMHLWLRLDIQGDSDDRPATIAAHDEDQYFTEAFNGMFDVSLHYALVNYRGEQDYLKTILDPTVLDLNTFVMQYRQREPVCLTIMQYL